MTVMSDGCQPVEAAAEGGDAGYGHAARGGHDDPTGTNLGAPVVACRVFLDASRRYGVPQSTFVAVTGHFGALLRAFSAYKRPIQIVYFDKMLTS